MGVIDAPQWLLPAYIRSVKALGATAPQDDVRAAGERLIEEWSTPDRHFHNLKHVIDMLARVDELADATHNPDVMRVAAWYHGYVFSSTREETYKRNGGEDEVASAAYAARDLQELGLPPATVDRVCALILNLKRHNLPANDIDAMALNDADLGTLAVEPQLYKKYRIAVREEYRHVPIQDYLEARLEIVSRLLSRDRLFSSPLGARWEEAARENLAGERRMLAAKLEALRSGASIEEASKVATRVWNQVPGTTEVASPVSTTPSTSYAPATTFSAFSPVSPLSPVSAASATTLSGGIPVVPPPGARAPSAVAEAPRRRPEARRAYNRLQHDDHATTMESCAADIDRLLGGRRTASASSPAQAAEAGQDRRSMAEAARARLAQQVEERRQRARVEREARTGEMSPVTAPVVQDGASRL